MGFDFDYSLAAEDEVKNRPINHLIDIQITALEKRINDKIDSLQEDIWKVRSEIVNLKEVTKTVMDIFEKRIEALEKINGC